MDFWFELFVAVIAHILIFLALFANLYVVVQILKHRSRSLNDVFPLCMVGCGFGCFLVVSRVRNRVVWGF
jgi:hypothetical protein